MSVIVVWLEKEFLYVILFLVRLVRGMYDLNVVEISERRVGYKEGRGVCV